VRERLQRAKNVEIRSLARVTEIVPSPDGSRATGVRFVDEDGTAGFAACDLVIDSSGRGTPTLALLQTTGRQEPEETQIGVNIGYTTARYRIPSQQNNPWKAVLHLPQAPATSRGALLYPMEGDQWILALGGRDDETPPGDDAGFLNWVRLLRTPTIFDTISGAERVGGRPRESGLAARVRRVSGRCDQGRAVGIAEVHGGRRPGSGRARGGQFG
jgi:hypothetical protein